jgi:hypothetical protein
MVVALAGAEASAHPADLPVMHPTRLNYIGRYDTTSEYGEILADFIGRADVIRISASSRRRDLKESHSIWTNKRPISSLV